MSHWRILLKILARAKKSESGASTPAAKQTEQQSTKEKEKEKDKDKDKDKEKEKENKEKEKEKEPESRASTPHAETVSQDSGSDQPRCLFFTLHVFIQNVTFIKFSFSQEKTWKTRLIYRIRRTILKQSRS